MFHPATLVFSKRQFPFMSKDNPQSEKDPDLIAIEITDRKGKVHPIEVPADVGLNVTEAAIASGVDIKSICGGMALCGGCHGYVLSDHALPPRSDQEEETLDKLFHVQPNSRLCCQIRVNEKINGLKIQMAPE
jgi:2Fe-2S ferredoxin